MPENNNNIKKNNEKKNGLYSECIEAKGIRVNNLKNINISVERGKFTVITGVSGSGKSSLAFDTLYAEGQRRYVESLSSYARQFLGRLNKPEVDFIKGIPPAIAVEQKVNTGNPRSTVGTSTEIYDYLKLLYARVGDTVSPVSGKTVKRHTVTDVVNFILSFPEKTRMLVLAPVYAEDDRTCRERLKILLKQGFSRVEFDGEIFKTEDLIEKGEIKKPEKANIVIDRISVLKNNDDFTERVSDSVQTAFYEGNGICSVKVFDNDKVKTANFSDKFEADGIIFEQPAVHMFDFNNPAGACPVCEGFGKTTGIDEDLVVPDKTLSVYQEAIACWRGEKMSWYKDKFIESAVKYDFPVHKPYFELTKKEKKLLWEGNKDVFGIFPFFEMIEKKIRKIQYRVMLARFRGKTICRECGGTRLKKEAGYVKIGGKSISDLVDLPVSELKIFFDNLVLPEHKQKTAERLLVEIKNRLQYLINTGLPYLTLNRLSSTLSGGESQRINLASSLGSSLEGSLYILDEPGIGLHPRDIDNLIKILKQLRDIGNTVIVSEHDEDIIKSADKILDIGPGAGIYGGNVVFHGTYSQILNENNTENSYTAKYLRNELTIPVPEYRRKAKKFIKISGVTHNNLKNIDVSFPLNVFTAVTGVSGSGKSSLVKDVFYPALLKEIEGYGKKPGSYGKISGNISDTDAVEFVSQNPIGKSSRSNPVIYIKAFDEIRKLFASQQLSKINGFKASHFSFNVDGGRCEACKGEGEITVEMQFMADVHLICEECKGKRYKDEILDVKYRGKNISDILDLTVEEAYNFFSENKETEKAARQIKPLLDVGLGYVKLGQSSNTLSGGESQRVKLASFLGKEKSNKKTLFIFDEPTTGLHFHDINKLLKSFDELIKNGNTVLVIEHNLDVIKSADYVIDLGPEGGEKGGYLVFSGTPEELVKCKKSYTGKYLKEKLK